MQRSALFESFWTPSVTAAPCQTFGIPPACLPRSGRQAPRSRRGSALILLCGGESGAGVEDGEKRDGEKRKMMDNE